MPGATSGIIFNEARLPNGALKGYGNIFLFGLSIRTFGVIAIPVVNFFVAC